MAAAHKVDGEIAEIVAELERVRIRADLLSDAKLKATLLDLMNERRFGPLDEGKLKLLTKWSRVTKGAISHSAGKHMLMSSFTGNNKLMDVMQRIGKLVAADKRKLKKAAKEEEEEAPAAAAAAAPSGYVSSFGAEATPAAAAAAAAASISDSDEEDDEAPAAKKTRLGVKGSRNKVPVKAGAAAAAQRAALPKHLPAPARYTEAVVATIPGPPGAGFNYRTIVTPPRRIYDAAEEARLDAEALRAPPRAHHAPPAARGIYPGRQLFD